MTITWRTNKMWALVAPLAKRFLRQSHSTPFWNAFPSVYLFFLQKYFAGHIYSKKVSCTSTLWHELSFSLNVSTWPMYLGKPYHVFLEHVFWGGHNMYHIGHYGLLPPYGTRTLTYLVMNQMFQCGRQHRQFVKPKTLILWKIRNHHMGHVGRHAVMDGWLEPYTPED